MPIAPDASNASPARLATLHALGFLVIGNAVGVLLAALQAFPRVGLVLGPLTYGRWGPVHLDLHLYGWGSLPLVALLLSFFAAGEGAPGLSRWAVHAWSAMVVAGAVAWLAGRSSGKPFLDWQGGAREVLVVAMSLLTLALVVAFARMPKTWRAPVTWARAALLLGLIPVPFVLAWAARPDVYPAVNPDSGGPTGVSLMGSVLGIVLLLAIVPVMLDLPWRRRLASWLFALLVLHGGVFLALDHGNHSHRELTQILALGSALAWLPLLTWMLRGFEWPRESRAWLASTLGWGVVLAASGILAFLPGVLERVKFGDALVAHAHVALAGFVTSWNMAILATLMRDTPLGAALGDRRWAMAWNATLVLHLAALAGLAALEVSAPGGLAPASVSSQALLLLRLAAGLGQLVVSARWLGAAWRAMSVVAEPAARVPSLAGRAA